MVMVARPLAIAKDEVMIAGIMEGSTTKMAIMSLKGIVLLARCAASLDTL